MNDPFKKLSADLISFRSMESYPIFLMKWLALFAAMSAISYSLLPIRHDVMTHFSTTGYHFENILWFSLSALSGFGLYRSSFPEKNSTSLFIPAGIMLLALGVMAAGHSDQDSLGLTGEMDLWRGRCGFLISTIALAHGSALFYWAKNGASSRPALSGIWIGLSSASLGCLLMQMVCAHDNSLHLLIWHFAPLVGLATLGTIIAKKWLRW